MLSRPAWARISPFAFYILLLAAHPILIKSVSDLWLPWLYAIQIAGVMFVMSYYWRDYVELRQRKDTHIALLDWALAVVLGVAVFVAWINLDVPFLSIDQAYSISPPLSNGKLDWVWIVVRIFGAAGVVPIMEELFWRSLVMRWIDTRDFLALHPKTASLRAVLISSLIFGMEHSLWFAGLLAGLVYAWLYRRGNLWLAIVSHAVTNLMLGIWVVATNQWQFW